MASSRNSAPADGRGHRPRQRPLPEMSSPPPPSRRERRDSSGIAGSPVEGDMGESPSAVGDDALVAVITAVADALDAYVASEARVAVALSGGMDSMVLLDALVHASAARQLKLS